VHDVADHAVVPDRVLRGLADRSQEAFSAGVAGTTEKERERDQGEGTHRRRERSSRNVSRCRLVHLVALTSP